MTSVYTLSTGHGLANGGAVRIEIDWPRRYALMRLHLAAELVLELVYRRLPGVEKTGAHIGADKARIDFSWPESIAPLIPVLRDEAQAPVDADHLIVSALSDEITGAPLLGDRRLRARTVRRNASPPRRRDRHDSPQA